MDSKKINAHAGETKEFLKKLMDGKKMDASEMLFATTNLMEFVKDYQELTGKEKKKLVEETIKGYIDDIDDDDNDKDLLNIIFEKVLPVAIDLFVDVARGKYKFKHIKKLFVCC